MANASWHGVMKLACGAIFSLGLILVAAPALADSFPSFDQKISVGADGRLTVQETVTVVFDTARHGIFRDIPVVYRTPAGNRFSTRTVVTSVTDGDYRPVPYSVSRSGDKLSLKIGDPQKTVSGRHAFLIDYTVDRALLFLPDQDQLYWNVIVEPWTNMGLPERVTAEVSLPPGVLPEAIKTRCFTVIGSSDEGGCQKQVTGNGADFSAQGTALTVVVGWPKNHVAAPTVQDRLRFWIADNGIVMWPLAVFLGMFLLWYKKGRDPRVKDSIVVSYEPPEGASPAELGALFDSAVGKEEVTATIVDLAVRGYLEIDEKKENGLLGEKTDYFFKLKNPDRSGLKPHEDRVLAGIFGYGAGLDAEVSMTELKYKFYEASEASKGMAFEAIVARGWFAKNPNTVRGIYIGAAASYLALVFFFGSSLMSNGTIWLISMFAPAFIIGLFGYFMPARTMKGTAAFAQALGFKEYLSKAEKYRLKWEEKENIFEKYLPYAMIFGVADKWAKAFEGLLNKPPDWYHGGSLAGWTPLIFMHDLNRASSAMGAVMFTAPSAKGGGGFGGGGFGGGGFGGGGGGSW